MVEFIIDNWFLYQEEGLWIKLIERLEEQETGIDEESSQNIRKTKCQFKYLVTATADMDQNNK